MRIFHSCTWIGSLWFSRCYSPHFILAAASFPEVSDRGELCVDGLAIKPTVVQVHDCFLCILLTTKLYVDIADKVVTQVITHIHLLHLPILLLHLCEHLLKELVVVLLHFHIADSAARSVGRLCTVLGITVDVLDQDGLAEGWFVVQSRAAVSMSASSNFKIEGTVDPAKEGIVSPLLIVYFSVN